MQVGIAGKPKKMLNASLEASLTKQGYKLVGSHSGVKLCRWTKAMLRGRGGCYKHTFYGIASYQCMEATPSLACANKCVFCWRHHKNPVGTSWRWETDDAALLVEGFLSKHRAMIKEMRGLPGVIPERLEEAYSVRHCALSLVGEPIIYPEINRSPSPPHPLSHHTLGCDTTNTPPPPPLCARERGRERVLVQPLPLEMCGATPSTPDTLSPAPHTPHPHALHPTPDARAGTVGVGSSSCCMRKGLAPSSSPTHSSLRRWKRSFRARSSMSPSTQATPLT